MAGWGGPAKGDCQCGWTTGWVNSAVKAQILLRDHFEKAHQGVPSETALAERKEK